MTQTTVTPRHLSAQETSAPLWSDTPFIVWLPWSMFAVLLFALLFYFVGAEQGATALVSGRNIHEFVHDGRHLLGFPCH